MNMGQDLLLPIPHLAVSGQMTIGPTVLLLMKFQMLLLGIYS